MGGYAYPNPQAVFRAQYQSVRRDEVVGVLLAFFLGGFGLHHFYLGRVGLGIFYCCLFMTPIPWILGFIECFFMPGRVRMYNAVQAAGLAAALGIGIPGYSAYPGWVAPGYGGQPYAPQPVYISVQSGASEQGSETILTACANCRHTNANGARFCSGCGARLA
jgi:TM2 domain-containing membrane protein YozV